MVCLRSNCFREMLSKLCHHFGGCHWIVLCYTVRCFYYFVEAQLNNTDASLYDAVQFNNNTNYHLQTSNRTFYWKQFWPDTAITQSGFTDNSSQPLNGCLWVGAFQNWLLCVYSVFYSHVCGLFPSVISVSLWAWNCCRGSGDWYWTSTISHL